MDNDPIEMLIDQEVSRIDRLPTKLRRFVFRGERAGGFEQSWGYFAHGYNRAFQDLAREALRLWPRAEYLRLPVFFLARHSLELAIKEVIDRLSQAASVRPELAGHKLLDLWTELSRRLSASGAQSDDSWRAYCGQLIKHLHDSDPDGERFRYPQSRSGIPFEYSRVVLEDLVKAQWNVYAYCDAVLSELDSSLP